MAEETDTSAGKKAVGHHDIDTESVISVEDVNRQAKAMAEPVSLEKISGLAKIFSAVSLA